MIRQLYIQRHGQAESASGGRDSDRNLTPAGMREMQMVARSFHAVSGGVDLILHSPYVRTTQTAGLMAECLGNEPLILSCPSLASGAGPVDYVDEIEAHPDPARILVIGHMPDVLQACTYLMYGQVAGSFDFVPGTIARIDFRDFPRAGGGVLRWFTTPESLRALTA